MNKARHLLPLLCLLTLAGCGNRSALPLPGTLERNRIALTAADSEPVVARPVHEGDSVRQGQILIRLDAKPAEAMLDKANAAYAQAEAHLQELVNGPRNQDIVAARARLKGAQGNYATARKEFDRTRDLVKAKVRSPSALDQARAQLASTRAERDAARAQLSQLLEGTRKESLIQARGAVAYARAAVTAARINVARLTVRAPYTGRIDALPYHLGERPPMHATVAVMLSATPVYADIYIPEPLRAKIHPGTAAVIRVDGRKKVFHGKVGFIATEAAYTPYYALTERDRSRLAYRAKVILDDGTGLPSGVPVTVDFPGLHR